MVHDLLGWVGRWIGVRLRRKVMGRAEPARLIDASLLDDGQKECLALAGRGMEPSELPDPLSFF